MIPCILAAIGAHGPLQYDLDRSPSFDQLIASENQSKGATPAPPIVAVDPGALLDSEWHLKLMEQGVSVACSYYAEFVGNPVGGKRQGVGNAASLGMALGLDFDKLAGMHGLSVFSSAVFRSGVNLSHRKIDNQFPVTQLYGGETIRLNEIYLKETLFDGNFNFKVGHMSGGNDFLSSPLYCQFISNAICGNPISIFFDVPFTAYPFSFWGAYLDFKPIPTTLFKFAVYNNNISTLINESHGCNFTLESTDGVTWITEWVYLLNQQNGARGNKGNYKLGGYYKTGKTDLFNGGSQTGNYGLYFLFDQMLYRKNGPGTTQGLTMFGSFLFAPPNRNRFPYFLDFCFVYKGLFPGRHSDYLSLGVASGFYSADLRLAEKEGKLTKNQKFYGSVSGTRPQTNETILELNYWYRFSKWFALTPGVQYVINPKGYGTTQNALVFELQVSIDLIGLPMQP